MIKALFYLIVLTAFIITGWLLGFAFLLQGGFYQF